MKLFSKNRRGILLLLLLAALLAAGAGIAVPLLISGLPDPAVANRDQLLRWLVARDLAKEPPKTRLVLVQRLEGEFRSGIDWEALNRKLTETQREQLWNNIPSLFGPWLSDKASAYSQLPKKERPRFIDGVIDSLMRWRGVERVKTQKAGEHGHDASNLMSVFLSQVEECKRNAEPQQRGDITNFLAALQIRILTR